jgi:UDP-N-acetylmuramoyl-L-alanyl-D-glutamate--2,6-diaminopimelate ligase
MATRNLTLSQLLDGVEVRKMFQTMFGKMVVTHEVMIGGIQYDSRKVRRDDLFVAIPGTLHDGSQFVNDAIANGAKAVVLENDATLPDSFFMHAGVVKIVVGSARTALAQIAGNYYGHPANELTMAGVTGTNGKTTSAYLLRAMLEANSIQTGLIGTIEYIMGSIRTPATHTTPESLELNATLRAMRDAECGAAVMEVSSHALEQHRVEGIQFAVALFTNLTQDHLDYHGTMDAYYAAKRLMFTQHAREGYSVINVDDSYGKKMFDEIATKKISYGVLGGVSDAADVRAKNVSLSLDGSHFSIAAAGLEISIASPLVGRFNVHNVLGAFAAGRALGISAERLKSAIEVFEPVAGRFERLRSPKGWSAIIDYAHTPDALEKTLHAIHDVLGEKRAGKIITVFGCGGNRDAGKRPKMGAIAASLSDVTIVTSDNPRHEDPKTIIDQVLAGIPRGTNVRTEIDRATAITRALDEAGPNDVVLIAGKGHEDYQVIGDKKNHFSDREIVQELIGL